MSIRHFPRIQVVSRLAWKRSFMTEVVGVVSAQHLLFTSNDHAPARHLSGVRPVVRRTSPTAKDETTKSSRALLQMDGWRGVSKWSKGSFLSMPEAAHSASSKIRFRDPVVGCSELRHQMSPACLTVTISVLRRFCPFDRFTVRSIRNTQGCQPTPRNHILFMESGSSTRVKSLDLFGCGGFEKRLKLSTARLFSCSKKCVCFGFHLTDLLHFGV